MNKILKTMMLAAVTAFGLASCEDVPAPFIEPEMPGAGGGEDITLPYTSANLKDGFEVYTPTGNAWSLGNTYAKATGYNSGTTTASETYLISPAIPLGDAEQVYVDFKYVIAYTNSLGLEEGHQVLVCSEYNTEDPAASNWVKLPFEPKEREDRNSWDMYSANTMSIPADMLGKEIRIAFLYKCNSNSASTWELTNLSVSTEPGGEVTPDDPETPDTPADGGTWDKPYTVAQAIANQTGAEVWVHGYIVGSIPADAAKVVLENMTFTADGASGTNLCIADVPNETNYANCAPVQLPAGSDARTDLNLMNNPNKLGVEVWLKGKTVKYCGAPGLKEISKYTLTAPTAEDDQEQESSDEPVEGAQGDGSLENPFNAAAAYNYTAALPADQATSEKFYVKGIVCESSKMDINTEYKNATFHISDDGSANSTQFLIFRTKGLNGADITSVDDVQVGDEVVVYASLVNYYGNTPETKQGGIIYSQKRNGQDIDGDTPGDDEGEGDQEDDDQGNAEDFSISMMDLYSEVTTGSVDAGSKTYNGVTFTFEQNDGKNMPKYYWNKNDAFKAVRMYALNKMTIQSDNKIEKVVLICNDASGSDLYNGNKTATVTAGTLDWADDNKTVTINDVNSNVVELVNKHTTNSGGVQLRIHDIKIYYAK